MKIKKYEGLRTNYHNTIRIWIYLFIYLVSILQSSLNT